MRKIVAELFVSLDGVVEAPQNWHFPYYNDEMFEVVESQLAAADTMLLGRHTYEEFVTYWPKQTGDVPLADAINGMQKLVVSTTLESLDWQNSTLISGNVAEELRRQKELPGKEISITGSPTLVRFLIAEGLLDELRLLVHPIIVGGGKRLFEDGDRVPLRLTESRTFKTGVLYLTYVPDTVGAAER